MYILVLDGIGSHGRTSGVIDETAHRLAENTGGEEHWLPWEASMMGIGGESLWPDSSGEGVRLIRQFMDTHSGDVVLLAYSGGNRPVHEFLDQHPDYLPRVRAVGLMSDPWRPNSRWQNGTPDPGPGYGIMGQDYGPIPDRTYWTTVPGDLISDADPDSLLRHVADTADGHLNTIAQEFIRKADAGRLQLAWFLGLPPWQWFFGLGDRINRAMVEAYGYVIGGLHTRGYVDPYPTTGGDDRSLAIRLADTISWKVRNPREEDK